MTADQIRADVRANPGTYVRRIRGVETVCKLTPLGTYTEYHGEVEALHGKGFNDCEIGRMLGIDKQTARRIRVALDLPANASRGRPKGR